MQKRQTKELMVSFEQIMRDQALYPSDADAHEPLAALKYDDELKLKDSAFELFETLLDCTIKVPLYKDIREMYLEKGREFTINFLKKT